jgi:hypothetical protein
LLSRVPEKSEREDRPHRSSPSHTPATAAGTTQREGRTPTPARFAKLERITRRPAIWAIAIAALGLVLLLAAGLWGPIASLSGISNSAGSGSTPENVQSLLTPQLAPVGPMNYDLRQKAVEKIWPGHYPSSVDAAFDEEARMLEVRSDSYRLLELGKYRGEPGTFEVTIRQAPWYGHAGLFFGYRHEARFNKARVATFQLFMLSHTTHFDGEGKRLRDDFGVIRSRSVLDFNPIARYEEFLAGARADLPAEQQVRLKITFRRNECISVSLAGQELPTLVSAEANGRFEPVDYLGSWGIYHCGGDERQKPTWFGDIVFTPLENDP